MKRSIVKSCLLMIGLLCISLNSALGDSDTRVSTGAVFVSSNSAPINTIHMYSVLKDGHLSEVQGSPFPVKVTPQVSGMGTGPGATLAADPLASQYSLIVDQKSRLLFVVNAISGSISSFKIRSNKLIAADTKNSGGQFPVSLTYRNGILYVVNAGGTARIQGFSVDRHGIMTPIPGTNIPLPYTGTFPLGVEGQPQIPQFAGQISFSPNGQQLLVLGKEGPDLRLFGFPPSIPPAGVQGPGHLFVYSMGPKGIPKGEPTSYTFPLSSCSSCAGGAFMKEPFAFTFAGRYVVVVEFFGNGSQGPSIFGGSGVSSLELKQDGTLIPISTSVPNNQGGVCWIVRDKDRLYTTNNTTDNLSLYSINAKGELSLVKAVVAEVGPGITNLADEAFPLDIAIGNKGRTLYQLTPGPSTAPGALVHAFSIDKKTGGLTEIGTVSVGTVPLAGQMGMGTIDFQDD